VITATGDLTGQFDGLSGDLSNLPFLSPEITYDTHDDEVLLTLVRNDTTFQSAARSANARGVGTALDTLESKGLLPDLVDQVAGLTDEQAEAALASLSGDSVPATAQVMPVVATQPLNMMRNRLQTVGVQGPQPGLTAAAAPAALAFAGDQRDEIETELAQLMQSPILNGEAGGDFGRYGIWLRGTALTGEIDSGDDVPDVDYQVYGLIGGIDRQVSESARLGLSLGWLQGDSKVDDRSGKSDSDSLQIGTYGRFEQGIIRLDGTLGYAYHDIDASRRVAIGSTSDRAQGSTDAHSIAGAAELSVRVPLPPTMSALSLRPLAGVEYVHYRQDGFEESGAGSANLEYDSVTTNNLKGIIGAEATAELTATPTLALRPRLRVALEHEFLDDETTVNSQFAGAPGVRFESRSGDLARDSLAVGTGVTLAHAGGVSVDIGYQGRFSTDLTEHAAVGTVRFTW
jgi:subtilase-type serine protease